MKTTAVTTDANETSMEDAVMGSTFDIFKVTTGGPLWIEAVRGLDRAKEQMAHLALTSPGDYFVHSQEQGSSSSSLKHFWKKYHDLDLHHEMPTLWQHSNEGEARATI